VTLSTVTVLSLNKEGQHCQTLCQLLDEGHQWELLPYLAFRDKGKKSQERTVYKGLGHTVTLTDEETGTEHIVRYLYVYSSAFQEREAARRHNEIFVQISKI